jgi:hypothetical protein
MREPRPAGAPAGASSIAAIVDGLEADGYRQDFRIAPTTGLVCGACGYEATPSEVRLDGLHRVEGASDPADMAAVLAVRCPACGAAGTCVVRYGPEAEPEHAELLLGIDDRRTH